MYWCNAGKSNSIYMLHMSHIGGDLAYISYMFGCVVQVQLDENHSCTLTAASNIGDSTQPKSKPKPIMGVRFGDWLKSCSTLILPKCC